METRSRWKPGRDVLAVVFCLMCCGAPAAAQTVQKCVGSDGHVTLTSEACGAGQRLAARYDAVPEPMPAAASAAAGRQETDRQGRRGVQRTVARRGTGRATAGSRPGADRCEAARARRERTLQRVGLKRTFDLLRKLDDEVRAACR
ncbi:DUF4124 domain-containing protein [Luteimonas sp. MC1750]|uniref:DUF4124 domain-containing protein n=1 Tax=Luteimonas sp. MC1750 TaxID=2799326 RepID=UPI0018F09B9F|nr:DUF4124 domain-containing protein [Luteimonas sp. MC1750]MBJ6984678.1 DUF4124 domain-containing protein [Luteimonas sp. MC1750]QQO04725.1 DUF4124 domain-containing protein [Luteimonas sp. MC1750]